MKTRFRSLVPAPLLAICLVASPASSLQVTLDSGVGSPLTIVDNDVNDLNPNPGEIDFATTVDGVLQADARVTQFLGPISRFVGIGTRTPGSDAVFANLDSASHTFTVTAESDAFSPPGPPLGWGIFYDALADDTKSPTQSDVEIPTNDVVVRVDPGDVLLDTLSAPVTPPVGPGGQPVAVDAGVRALDPSGDATELRIIWSFTPGPRDEIRMPDPTSSGEPGISASVFNAQDKCVFRMNKDAAKLAQNAGLDDTKCVKDTARSGGDATACVDDQGTRNTARSEDRLLLDFPAFCASPPAFAVNLGTCCEGGASDGDACSGPLDCPGGACAPGACISGAAEDAAGAITHDLFGPAVSVAASLAGRCQTKVMTAAVKLHGTRWTVLTDCKRRNIASLASEADFVTTCLGPPQPDVSAKIPRYEARLTQAVDRDCLASGVTSLASVFPGACASEDGDYAACIARRVACRFCLGAVVADGIVSPLDCDVFDDGTSNGGCP
jgi:hypothetical protein